MKLRWNFLLLILLVTLGATLLIACGSSKSSSSSTPAVDDDDNDNDDATPDDDDNDDDNDDATPDDDDDNDDDSSPQTVYPQVTCTLPDPGSIAPNTVGGGAITTTVTAYVFDNFTCAPITSATVNGQAVDSTGKVVLDMTTPAPVTAMAAGYWTWSYTANANTMYFRLQTSSSTAWAVSSAGNFQSGGTDLALSNPNTTSIGTVLTSPIYLGATIPGISRKTVLETDFDNIFAASANDWDLTYGYNVKSSKTGTIALPANIYFPPINVDISILGYGGSASGGNPSYMIPVNPAPATTTQPVEGFVLSATVGNAISLSSLIALIPAIIANPSDIIADLLPLVPDVINKALAFEYAGVNPTWDGTSAPNLDTVDIPAAKETVDVTVANAEGGYNYLTVLAGEVPNVAFWPIGLQLADSTGAATIAAAPLTDADYMLAVAKTNLLTILGGATQPLVVELATKFAGNLNDLATVSVDNNADFVTEFDPNNTAYTNGTVSWALGSDTTLAPDLFVVIVKPTTGSVGIALVPNTVLTFDAATIFGYTPATTDTVILASVKFPTGPTANAYDPTTILAYDLAGINVWTNYNIAGLL